MKNTLNDEKLKEKFTEDDKKVIEEASKEGLQWLEGNAMAEPEEIEAKQKEIEAKFNPIMMRVYQAAGGAPGGMPGMGGMGGAPGAGPTAGDNVNDLD
jgi:heat shock 70kDa protein 1/2/6/8